MPSFRYDGGDQQPDAFGVLTPGDVLELAEMPAWGQWSATTKKVTGPSPTPQPAYEPVEQPAAQAPLPAPATTAKEG